MSVGPGPRRRPTGGHQPEDHEHAEDHEPVEKLEQTERGGWPEPDLRRGGSSPADDPPTASKALKLRELEEFLLYLGSALSAAGEAVNHIEEHLRRVASAYGAPDARVSVLPTYLVVALEPGRPATLEPTRQLRGVLRLDQTAATARIR